MERLNGGCVAFYSASAAGKPTGVGGNSCRAISKMLPGKRLLAHYTGSGEWDPKVPAARRLLSPRALLAILSESSFCIFGGL